MRRAISHSTTGGLPLRRRALRIAALPLALFVVAGIAAFDAFVVEPYAVQLTRDTIALPVRAPLTIAHLSDLHTHGFGRRERRVVELVAEAHPDLIVVTGDTVDGDSLEPARELFTRLSAPLGIWVVRGNWENWRHVPNERAFYESVGAAFLVNEGAAARADVWIAGLDDPSSGWWNLGVALRDAPEGAVRIALFHAPEAFDELRHHVDLAFAGHTHGGQVRLPLLPPLWLPAGSGRFVQGWYQKGTARMVVSRGIGTSLVPVRFFCRAQVEVVSVVAG
jgi:predicted MPP superfamily phosphohydrolase